MSLPLLRYARDADTPCRMRAARLPRCALLMLITRAMLRALIAIRYARAMPAQLRHTALRYAAGVDAAYFADAIIAADDARRPIRCRAFATAMLRFFARHCAALMIPARQY